MFTILTFALDLELYVDAWHGEAVILRVNFVFKMCMDNYYYAINETLESTVDSYLNKNHVSIKNCPRG